MIHISRPIGQATVQSYYREAYTMGDYYSQEATLRGHWFGHEAEALGLIGETNPKDFDRIMSGRRPDARFDAEQLTSWEREGTALKRTRFVIRDKETNSIQAEVHMTSDGWVHSVEPEKRFRSVGAARTAAHRSLIGKVIHYRQEEKARRAWDIVSRPGKTVSLAAVVGGDKRIIAAHRRANAAMLRALEQLIQARGGGNNPAITTGRFIVARFEHYTARPEEVKTATGETVLYPAALLHTHNVMANWTRTPEGKIRSIEPWEMFKFQSLGKAVYQAHMAHELRMLGYQVEYGKNGAPEIAGYTKEYLESESLRSINIHQQLVAQGLDGARASNIVAKAIRNEKLDLSEEEVAALHRANDAAHGNQNARIIGESLERAKTIEYAPSMTAEEAVTMAKRSLAERQSVFEHWDLVVKALEYGQGQLLEDAITRNIAARTQTPEEQERGIRAEFMVVDHVREGAPGIRYTTDIQHACETDLCEVMAAGRNTVEPLARNITAAEIVEQLECLATPQNEHELQIARNSLVGLAAQLRERIATPAQGDADPYWQHWYEEHGRPLEEPTAVGKSPKLYEYIDALNERYAAWRESAVAADTAKLFRIEKRLALLDGLDVTVTKNRLQIKADVSRRFEVLTGGLKPNRDQVVAAHTILTSPDRLSAIVGSAGSGKTTVLQAIQAVAQEQGYRVLGVAPTAKAVEKMEEKGIQATTLQGFLLANTPEAIERARITVQKGEAYLGKLADRLAITRQKVASTEASLAKAIKALADAQQRFRVAEQKAVAWKPARSVQAVVQQQRRREYYATRVPVLAARIRLCVEWKDGATKRLQVLSGRIGEIEKKTAEVKQHLELHRKTTYDRGVSLDRTPRLVFADESSLAGNRQFAELFRLMESGQDRIVLVGDPGQHESIEASRAFDLLLQAGIRRGEIYEVVRQKTPELRQAVEKCTWGKHHRALDLLKKSGHVQEIRKRFDRLRTLTKLFMKFPDESLVIVPDNRTRLELNELIREQWKATGRIHGNTITAIVLVSKQDLTAVDREVAAKYEVGQLIRCREGSKRFDMERGSYWTVASTDTQANRLSLYQTGKDGTIQKRSFDPAYFRGTLEVFDKQQRELAVGDKVLFKRKWKEHGIVNGTAAIVEAVDPQTRTVTVRLSRNQAPVSWHIPAHELSAMPHIEHGYATTSYSVQGDTARYTYAHFDTGDKGARRLISRAMFYVAASRPEHELQIVTNDSEKLRHLLETANDKAMALSPEERYQYLPEQYHQQHGMAVGV